MSKSIILASMVFALCVARLATITSGSGADQMIKAEGLAMAAQISQSV
jgi:hypothetical protein